MIKKLQKKIQQLNPHVLKIGANVYWLAIGKAFKIPLSLFVGALVARHLQPEAFGFLNYIVSFAGFFSVLSVLGIKDVAIKNLAQAKDAEKGEILGSVFVLQLAASILNALLWTGISFYLYRQDPFLLSISIAVGCASLLKLREVVIYYFESEVRGKILVRIDLSIYVVSIFIKLALVYWDASILYFGFALLADWLVGVFLSRFYFKKYSPGIKLKFSPERAKKFLQAGWPLILSGLSVSLAMRIDQVMLEPMMGAIYVGFYSASVRLAEPMLMFGGLLLTSSYPLLMQSSESEFEARFKIIFRLGFYSLLSIAILVSIFSTPIVQLIYGTGFGQASRPLSLLVFSIPITFVSMMGSNYLMRYDAYKGILSRQLAGLSINVSLNLYFIPKFGILGAALATVLTDVTIALLIDVFTERGRQLLLLKVKSVLFLK